jgi:hypothetical protein
MRENVTSVISPRCGDSLKNNLRCSLSSSLTDLLTDSAIVVIRAGKELSKSKTSMPSSRIIRQ